MKKNLFVLMLSAFVLMNAQPSYAMMEIEENKIKSPLPTPSLPTPSLPQKPREKRWIPQAPMKEDLLNRWIKKANDFPGEYRIVGDILWRLQ
ncbi:MAG: hypothetical protein K2Y08_04740 [Alphaproteobacteria bacterium]|nr:hypothetical protein [Alphaproteobacteria bacterium]